MAFGYQSIAEKDGTRNWVRVNRAAVLTLWLFQPTRLEIKEQSRKMRKEETASMDLLHHAVPTKYTDEGLRALSGDSPIRPESVQEYPEGKFGEAPIHERRLVYQHFA